MELDVNLANSTRHFCHDLELHGGDLISWPVDSSVSSFTKKNLRTQLCGEKLFFAHALFHF